MIVPEECLTDRGELSHKVALFEIDMKYGDVLTVSEVAAHINGIPTAVNESMLVG